MTSTIINRARARRLIALKKLQGKRSDEPFLPRFRNLPEVSHAKASLLFQHSCMVTQASFERL